MAAPTGTPSEGGPIGIPMPMGMPIDIGGPPALAAADVPAPDEPATMTPEGACDGILDPALEDEEDDDVATEEDDEVEGTPSELACGTDDACCCALPQLIM